jgi:hypothetical protein
VEKVKYSINDRADVLALLPRLEALKLLKNAGGE